MKYLEERVTQLTPMMRQAKSSSRIKPWLNPMQMLVSALLYRKVMVREW